MLVAREGGWRLRGRTHRLLPAYPQKHIAQRADYSRGTATVGKAPADFGVRSQWWWQG